MKEVNLEKTKTRRAMQDFLPKTITCAVRRKKVTNVSLEIPIISLFFIILIKYDLEYSFFPFSSLFKLTAESFESTTVFYGEYIGFEDAVKNLTASEVSNVWIKWFSTMQYS